MPEERWRHNGEAGAQGRFRFLTPEPEWAERRPRLPLTAYNGGLSPLSLSKRLALALMTLVIATCGRTDLELGGTGGRGPADASLDGPRDARMDASDGATGGVVASGGRGVATGGRPGTGGRAATGGSGGRGTGGGPATGGRPGTGGAAGTGGRVASGGSGGVADGGIRDSSADGLIDAAGPDLPPSTPGTLSCGTQACNVKTQTCCVSLAVGSVGAACIPVGTACTGAALICDEPADCPGAVCCFGVQAGGDTGGLGIGSQCAARAACNGFGRFIVCRTNADCGGTMPACCSVGGVPVCQTACLGN